MFKEFWIKIMGQKQRQEFEALLRPIYDDLFTCIYSATTNKVLTDYLMQDILFKTYGNHREWKNKDVFKNRIFTMAEEQIENLYIEGSKNKGIYKKEKNSEEIPITPVDKHLKELYKKMDITDRSFKKPTSLIKVSMIAVAIIFFSSLFSLWIRTEEINAFKFEIDKKFIEIKEVVGGLITNDEKLDEEEKSINEEEYMIEKILTFDEARGKIPFDFIQSSYIPEEYTPRDVRWIKYLFGEHLVVQTYVANDGNVISINQEYNITLDKEFRSTIDYPKGSQAKEMNINGLDILMVNIEEDFTNALWYDDSSSYEIMGTISEDEMIQIIENIYQ